MLLNGNEELLYQVWMNLLDNALKFSPSNSVVHVSLYQDEQGYHFSFSNKGPTMSQNTMTHLFDKFYQGDPSHTEKGNGLGLAIAKKIIELHNGMISVSQSEDDEITFYILI